jgi:hypothetical protein
MGACFYARAAGGGGGEMSDETALTVSEEAELCALELTIERGLKTFVDVGTALMEIRDKRLYRQQYGTFEDYCRERWGMVRQNANRLIAAAETVSNLEPMGSILPTSERQVRPLTQLEPKLQAEAWQAAVERGNGKPTGVIVQEVVDEIQQRPHVANNSGNNEWYTPAEYIEAARAVLGEIYLDPASSDIAQKTVKAKIYFTAEDDGLRYQWDGRVWMNPPYASELIGKFAEKLVNHFAGGDVPEAVVLVNNATETGWFQSMLDYASAVCFVRRRIKFVDQNGNPSGAPLQGQAILYLGDDPARFTQHFAPFGAILYGHD